GARGPRPAGPARAGRRRTARRRPRRRRRPGDRPRRSPGGAGAGRSLTAGAGPIGHTGTDLPSLGDALSPLFADYRTKPEVIDRTRGECGRKPDPPPRFTVANVTCDVTEGISLGL